MDQPLKLFRVFIASPNDLGEERRALRELVEKINFIYSKETECRAELLGWEDTLPGSGRPQELINADLDKADLFVGCLWQRWGTDTGKDGKTGFEEEFDRSIERREKTGSPEICLFFKKIPPLQQADPGVQLQKVLDFRKREIEGKRLLFKDFSDAADWQEAIDELLHRHMIRLYKSSNTIDSAQMPTPSQAQGPVDSSETTSEAPKASSNNKSDPKGLLDLFDRTATKLRNGELIKLDNSEPLTVVDTVRLLLFSTANYDWNCQHVQFGVHEINSVFFLREKLNLTSIERLFLIRTALLDSTHTRPSWYWTNGWGVTTDAWIVWFATFDSEETARKSVIDIATRMGWSLLTKRKQTGRPIERLILDPKPSVRLAALRHIAELGGEKELKLANRLLQDDNKEIRVEAERSMKLIRLKLNIEKELMESLSRGDEFDDGIVRIINASIQVLSEPLLKAALSSRSGALRFIASRELMERGLVDRELATKMCSDQAKGVQEIGYIARAMKKDSFDMEGMITHLREESHYRFYDPPQWNKSDPEKVVQLCLNDLSEGALWERVHELNHHSHAALSCIGDRYFESSKLKVRSELSDDFTKMVAIANAPPNTRLTFPPRSILIETARKQLRIVALRLLASNPDRDDRELFLKYLSTDPDSCDQCTLCLQGLSKVGIIDDCTQFLKLFDSKFSAVEVAAARAYLTISSSAIVAAKDILSQPSSWRVWTIVNFALKIRSRDFWPQLQDLLHNEDSDIRRIICFYTTQVIPRAELIRILQAYLSREPYYYDVVTLLDRFLYAPKNLKELYIREERDYFEARRPDPKWYWSE